MEITIPVRYYPVYRCSYQYVPLYVQELHPDTVEIPDIWKEVKVHRRYSAIHHVKLPRSFVYPVGGDNVRLAPFMTQGGSSAIHETMDLDWSVTQSDVRVTIPLAGRRTFFSYCLFYPRNNGTWYLYPTGSGVITSLTGVFCDSEPGKYYYVQESRKPKDGRFVLSEVSFSSILAAFETCPVVSSKKLFVSASTFIAAEHRPSATQLTNWVESSIKSHEDFEQDSLVASLDHLEYSRRFGKTVCKKVKSHTRPLWVESNADYLNGKDQAYVDALHDCARAGTNNLKNLINAYNACWHFICNRENMDAVFNALATGTGLRKRGFGGIEVNSVMHGRVTMTLPQLPEAYVNKWFGGRYVLNCAVMDAGQAWNYFYRQTQVWMGQQSEWQKCHGSYTDEAGRTWQCTFSVAEKAHTGLSKLFQTCYTYGLEPNAYVIWDLIPYSFVADWFIPIGSTLEVQSLVTHSLPTYWNYIHQYGPYSMCYSLHYKFQTEFGECDTYTRWYEPGPPNVDTWEFFTHNAYNPSERVECMRVVDAFCLLFR